MSEKKISERTEKFLEESEIMREIHEKAQDGDGACLGVKEVAKKTGLKYMDGGEIKCHGGYIPRGVMKGGIKEALIRWRWIDGDIDDIQREMRLLESRFNDPAIARYIERTGGKATGRAGIDELLANREKLEGQFMDELAFLLQVRGEIHRFVGMLDEEDREIITLRYLKGLEWEAVGEIVGRNYTRACNQVHKILEHYDRTGEYLITRKYRRHKKAK